MISNHNSLIIYLKPPFYIMWVHLATEIEAEKDGGRQTQAWRGFSLNFSWIEAKKCPMFSQSIWEGVKIPSGSCGGHDMKGPSCPSQLWKDLLGESQDLALLVFWEGVNNIPLLGGLR